jgi:LysM repeat protein
MKQWNRIVFFLLLNVIVSVCATLSVLMLWDRTQSSILTESLAAVKVGRNSLAKTANAPAQDVLPAATPTPSVIIHAVVAGDTFKSIAAKYNVSVAELLIENGYSKDQPLSTGDLIRVPIRIVNIDSVVGVGDLDLERVVIRSLVSSELPLAGWTLTDESGKTFIFPKVTIYAEGGSVNVFSKKGVDTVLDLYWGQTAPVWSSGEVVTLRDSAGSVRAIYNIP